MFLLVGLHRWVSSGLITNTGIINYNIQMVVVCFQDEILVIRIEIFFILVQISQLSLSFQFLFAEMRNNVPVFVINYNTLTIMFVFVVKILSF